MSNGLNSPDQFVKPLLQSDKIGVPQERIKDLRKQIMDKIPAAETTLRKAGIPVASGKMLKNTAGELVRQELTTEAKLTLQIENAQKEAEEAKKRAEKAEDLSMTDMLTDLPNRRAFELRLKEEIRRIERDGNTELVIFFLDVNNLKTLNDQSEDNHTEGDKCLRRLSGILKENKREHEMFARWGGDEFIGVLIANRNKKTWQEEAIGCWERLDSFFQSSRDETGTINPISISAGACKVNPRDTEWSIKKADEAMYEAKRISKSIGKNHFMISPESTA